jgi:Fe-S oxidoreductase
MKGLADNYKGILAYERRGISKRYSWYGLPEDCDTVFFPGCTLPGIRPQRTLALFEYMQRKIPSLGIVLDCCTKISHDLGRQEFFLSTFNTMRQFLVQNGVKNVIVACPSCYKIFEQYGEGLCVKSVYELLADDNPEGVVDIPETVTVHDPCAMRFNNNVQDSVRKIITGLGLTAIEMPHSRSKTLCCGEGGSVKYLSPELAKKWTSARKQETENRRVITYCAGCVNYLGKTMPASHVLDLFFDAKATLSNNIKVSKSPMTYWNRLCLKRRLKKTFKTAVSHERSQ